MSDKLFRLMRTQLSVLKSQQRRIRQLESALKPFAAEAKEWATHVPPRYRPGLTESGYSYIIHGAPRARFTIGHLRRAARLLKGKRSK